MSKILFVCSDAIDAKIKEFIDKNSDFFTKGDDEDNKSAAVRALIIRGLKAEGLWE